MKIHSAPLATLLLLAGVASAIVAYRERPPALAGVETLPALPPEDEAPAPPADLRPPQAGEVALAVERVFPSAVPREAARTHWAVMGDWNGDDSPDLAVPARVVDNLVPTINDSLANWIVQNPLAPPLGPEATPRVQPVVIAPGDTLLAVIHGHGPAGWRNPEARQGYILKIVLAGPLERKDRADVVAVAVRAGLRFPRLRGDLLYEPAGRRFLFWTGARYFWHPMPEGAVRSS